MNANTPDGDPSSVDFGQMGRKRHRWLLVSGAVLLAATGVAGGALYVSGKRHQESLIRSWSALHGCLVGSAIGAGESAGAQVRNGQLTEMGIPPTKRAKFGEHGWPGRCASHAHALAEELRSHGSDAPLLQSATALAKALTDEKSLTNDLGPGVERVWADAATSGLVLMDMGGTPPPPRTERSFSQSTLPPGSRLSSKTFTLSNLRTEPYGSETLRFLVDDPELPEGPVVCTTRAQEPMVSCRKVPPEAKKLSPGLRLWGTVDSPDDAVITAGDRGSAGIFSLASGKQLAALMTYGVSVRAGTADLLTWNDETKSVQWLRPGGASPREQKLLDRKDGVAPICVEIG